VSAGDVCRLAAGLEVEPSENHHPLVGVVLHGVSDAFASYSGLLCAAVRHLVCPVARDIANDDANHHDPDITSRPRTRGACTIRGRGVSPTVAL
jgi:hypothetical protein